MVPDVSGQLATDLVKKQSTDGGFDFLDVAVGRQAIIERNDTLRGLPDDEDLLKMARMYLEMQRKLWPSLADDGTLPALGECIFQKMAEDFKKRFVSKETVRFKVPLESLPCNALGVAYARYSSDSQNPRSLDDQLFNQLTRAKQDNVFIPFEYVFADAGVSGTFTKRRNGYGAGGGGPVPEPATLAMLAIGAAALVGRKRK